MKENKRKNNLDKNNTRFSIRKYQGYGATSVAIIGFIIISCFSEAKADSDKHEIKSHQQSMTNHLTTLPSDNQENTSNNEFNNRNHDISHLSLNKSIQMDELKKLIKQYKAINLNDKTEESIKLFQSDLVQAESLINNPQSQQHVDAFYHKFLNSAGKLRKKETVSIKHERSESNTYRLGDEVRSQTFSHIRHKRNAVSFRNADQSNLSTDPLKANEINPEIQNGNFSQVSGGPLPTSSKRLTVVTNVDNWHSYSTDPNPEYPMFYTTTAVNYPNFMSNGNAPYGVILGRTTDGWNRNVIDSKVAGIYQDIDVVPGSELNVNFISTSPVFSDGAAGAKLKISNVEQNRVLFDSRLNGMGPYPTGKLSAMVNIPNDINRVRISFLPVSSTGRVSVQRSSREHGFGDNSSYYHGGSVSDVRINSGSYVVSKVTQREYTTRPNSSNDTFARATINLSVENKGHNQSKDTYYEVILPQNSRLISTRGGSGNYNNATNKLSIRLDNLNPGDRRDISYTVDFESSSPKLINLNAHLLYKTNATFRGNDGQRTGDNIVDLQSIALLMNKDVLETELNEIDKFIRDLNEADFTIDSWSALQEKMTEGGNILNEQQNQVALENQASQETINNVTQSLEILKNNLKYKTPSQPIIKSNNQIPNITISPADKADKLTITYQNTDNESASIIGNKLNNQWSLNNNIPGIEIDMQTGLVTIDYKAVYPESVVGANDKTGNSDESAESRITMPRKEATPLSPIVEANEERVNVVIAPNGEATQIAVKYRTPDGQEATLVASKNESSWTLNKQIDYVNIDENSGKVTIGYQAVQPESEVIATETKGNSDASAESRVTMPRKEATPHSPIVEANEERVNVVIAPNGEAIQIAIKYRTPDGQETTLVASKNESSWTLNKQIDYVNIEENSGKVTIGYQAVQLESEVIATETKGNSDASAESRITMPRKEATPHSPIVEANEEHVNVTIAPNGEATQIAIKYRTPDGQEATLVASKNESSWTLNKQIDHVNIEENSGKVTIGYQAVQPESEIIATETKGNSDASAESRITMPRKEATPIPPTLEASVQEASVTVTPNENATKVFIKYLDINDEISTIIASKINQQWTLNKDNFGIKINPLTGKVIISYVAVQPESDVIAIESQGNSDLSEESRIIMPTKEEPPEPPILESDSIEAKVNIFPNDEATRIVIMYTSLEGQEATLVASKNESSWTLNKQIDHVNIDENSGKVTIGYQAVQPESEVIATETKGNSDESAESRVTMPRKEATPHSPIVEANEEHVNVTIAPNGEATQIAIKYRTPDGQETTLIASKNGSSWTLNKQIDHVNIDENSGKVTIGYQAVQPESEVIATETKGNSDASAESRITMPVKEKTPAPPISIINESNASVEIIPQVNVTQLSLQYIDAKGQQQNLIATLNQNQWTLNKNVSHITVDKNTGKVLINYQAVYPESEVIARESKGNSDSSNVSMVIMPRKTATPKPPIIKVDEMNASLAIIPYKNNTAINIHYIDKKGIKSMVTAIKNNDQWQLDEKIKYVKIDAKTGTVIINYQIVQENSEIIATAINGNSDKSEEVKVLMPIKEFTPLAPLLETNYKKATVSILPQSNATKLDFKYRDKKGDSKIIIVKRFKNIWKANEQISGVTINPEFGQVVINYQAVYPESDILAAQYVGNSDASEWAKVKMPKKELAPHSPSLIYDNRNNKILIAPNSNATEMELSYVDKNNQSLKVKALKINNRWKFDSSVSNISINPNTGKIVLQPQFLLTNSKIIVFAKKGNSDASISVSLRVPAVKKIELEPMFNVPVSVSLNKKRIQFDDCSGVKNCLNKQISKTQLPDTGYSDKASKSNILSVLLLGFGFLSYSRKRKEKQ
ncbi:SasC/FmtB family protein [Staphylococcus epidermidis]|uniref:SasC/FmtB family protein n=2 Tax=Staphylococcus epidermidis TaxID=1282 RepID=UPI00136EF773|nr:SasC/FmtB family protein [Staphylococcus epidermidis]MCG2159339.1 LPXTG cell wall anchor domain-containing protein [Staphylococcus epidermidis]MDS3960787.1 LPXTG cell wall anchor domain-containing protein [Staphylococcus epidermidis]NAM69373.1 LPXTG cell wall anchor domain-containing protein [Staphylococcus epidermidis]NAM84179.1 LPXTG cell wall anchor domain-containing protein [Staphylococcus epidermidis]NAM86544.1 LPXTG cell wall anchor domain-containing protein [Staphylococcus epidermidi